VRASVLFPNQQAMNCILVLDEVRGPPGGVTTTATWTGPARGRGGGDVRGTGGCGYLSTGTSRILVLDEVRGTLGGVASTGWGVGGERAAGERHWAAGGEGDGRQGEARGRVRRDRGHSPTCKSSP
jgi:hypothetical protein